MESADPRRLNLLRGLAAKEPPWEYLGSREAPLSVAGFLFVAYLGTLAPSVTFWDSGEFLAAMKTLGIPHPPGTPLYILIGNVWGRLFGGSTAYADALNMFSALSTAAACGVFTYLFARWTRDHYAAAAGGVLAGLMSSVWLNANETEVYAPALFLSSVLLLVAQYAVERREVKWFLLLGYLCGLGWSLQLSALVAAPAAFLLAVTAMDPHAGRWIESGNFRRYVKYAPAFIGLTLLGASVVFFMLVRARYDPGVNQGNPSTWPAFVDVLARAQYQPVAMLPRQAPWFIQIGNVFEYADWQVALGLDREAPPSWRRTPITIAYALLGVGGFVWHRRTHRPSWRVMSFLFVCATLGVVAYLNMKASPSYGHGFLPPDAKHEARERDYFFALAFVCWGMWAGAGAVRLASRGHPKLRWVGLVIAAVPLVLNAPAVDRSREAGGLAAVDSARTILLPAPPRAVVFAYGDNDTYPAWYVQHVEGARRDVTLVTIPLLGAGWYRAELARRHGLLSEEHVNRWRGHGSTLVAICVAAESMGRPVIARPVRDRPDIPEECFR